MEYKSIKGFTGWGSLGILFVFLGAGFVLTGIVQAIIMFSVMPPGTTLTNMGDNMMKAMMDPKNVSALRLSQVLGTMCFFFIPAVLYSLVTNGKNKWWLGFNKYLNIQQILLGVGIIYAANIAASPLVDVTKSILVHFPNINAAAKKMEDLYNDQVLAISNLKSWGEYLMAIVIMAFFPAMFEEVFFRGALQGLLVRWWKKPLIAIIAASIIFSAVHMSIYLFLNRAILGFALGILYYKSKNIWINIIAHFLNNAIAVTMLFYLSMKKEKLDLAKIDPKVEWWVGLIGLAAFIGLLYAFDKISADKVARIAAKEETLIAKEDPFRGFAEIENNEHGDR